MKKIFLIPLLLAILIIPFSSPKRDVVYASLIISANTLVEAHGAAFDGGGSVLAAQVRYWRAPMDYYVNKATIWCQPSGSIVIDVYKDIKANFPPTNSVSITSGKTPTLSGAALKDYCDSGCDDVLTGWTRDIDAGDFLAFAIEGSPSTATTAVLILELKVK